MIEARFPGLDQLSFLIMENGGNIQPKEIAAENAKARRGWNL
jgi:hypothetical protein